MAIPDCRVMALREKKEVAGQVERIPLEIRMAEYSYQRTPSITELFECFSVFPQKDKIFRGDFPVARRGRRNIVVISMNSNTSEGRNSG